MNLYINSLKQKGDLAYEYSPLYNFQTSENLLIDETNGIIFPEGESYDSKTGQILHDNRDKYDNIIPNNRIVNDGTEYAKAGSLIGLDTEKLNFDLKHPVEIEAQSSYDGSVNLILNDNKNIPRLINTRFSVTGKNTYEIVDRVGENDTNIYNSETFDKDTSLYFQCDKNPTIKYKGLINGNLPVGQYCFYFVYSDSDENESDYVAETGVIPVFIGEDGNPSSMDGGIKNQNSTKGVKLELSNLDDSYNYLKIYLVRYFADYEQNRVVECKKLFNKYSINSTKLEIQITGNENFEEIDPNILNISRFNPKSVLTQAQCKNMLFFGNIVKNTDDYKELIDCALKIIPNFNIVQFKNMSNYYNNSLNKGYYDSNNMYNYVGYMDNEFYRFGVVFIYNNGTLSSVYNTLGYSLIDKQTPNNIISQKENTNLIYDYSSSQLKRRYLQYDDNNWVQNINQFFNVDKNVTNINSKGVCQIKTGVSNDNSIIKVKFYIPNDVKEYLKKIGIRGLFFVRQKRIPNILAQFYMLRMDKNLNAPVIKCNGKYRTESFLNQTNQDKLLSQNYSKRIYIYNNENNLSKNAYAGICPDFLLNQPYYNQIFNGSSFRIEKVGNGSSLHQVDNIYTDSENIIYGKPEQYIKVKICTVTESVPTVAINNCVYRLNIGEGEEVTKFKFIDSDKDDKDDDINLELQEQAKTTKLARGIYSPYLAIYSESELIDGELYNIYRENSLDIEQEILLRSNSSEPFYAISDRLNFDQFSTDVDCYRGDCFINTFTYRLNRNFNDSTLPNNDKIIQYDTWKHFGQQDEWTDISRADVNAVRLGSWITFKVRSSFNYALRSENHAYVSEEATMGSPRSFYPRSELLDRGANKMPDSYLYNDAYRSTLGFKCYYTQQDVNYIKNNFSNRIQYSEIAIQDSYKNNYRSSLSTYFRDYSSEYGQITKLISFDGYLLVVLEHAIGIAVINERVLVGQGEGEPVFLNTKNVLPEELTIITDTYGTQWGDSVIKTESGTVYGVDTISKKIWKVKGQQLELISDFKVESFLNENITFGEKEKYPIIGIKNVKTHYNNYKKDVMFTFYDDLYEDEERVWNLCYNELLGEFITFYSWLPSYSANIDTQFFSFDRNTSKYLTLINKSNYYLNDNYGVLLDTVIIDENTKYIQLYYKKEPRSYITQRYDDGTVGFAEVSVPNSDYIVYYRIKPDHWQNYKLFSDISDGKLNINYNQLKNILKERKIIILNIAPVVNGVELLPETVAFTSKEMIHKGPLTNYPEYLQCDFYLHGKSGLIDLREDIYPTRWYGKTHPFEFEFIVNDKLGQQKIFENLEIISNKAEPESFHFEIEGDNYDFSSDKRTMYYRQELTKEVFQNHGSNILFNRKYTDVTADLHSKEQYYREKSHEYTNQYKKSKVYPIQKSNLVQQVKSSIFPLYYNRIDNYDEIYDRYQLMTGNNRDYQNLSGSEINWIKKTNQFNVCTHIKNSPINLVGRLRGNSYYKEGKWYIQIPSITFMQKNEDEWTKPPLVFTYKPSDVNDYIIGSNLPNTYTIGDIDTDKWTYRKETKMRDKWIKIKVRYSGYNLAIIHSIITLYNISYS